MKKEKKFSNLNNSDMQIKQNELLSELIKFKVSMDPSAIRSAANLVALKRDFKEISRKKAISAMKESGK